MNNQQSIVVSMAWVKMENKVIQVKIMPFLIFQGQEDTKTMDNQILILGIELDNKV